MFVFFSLGVFVLVKLKIELGLIIGLDFWLVVLVEVKINKFIILLMMFNVGGIV